MKKLQKRLKHYNLKSVFVILLVLLLGFVLYIVNGNFKFNLNKYAKVTDPICISGEVQYKSCSDGSTSERVCDSSGTKWSPWGSCGYHSGSGKTCKVCEGDILRIQGGLPIKNCGASNCQSLGCNSKCGVVPSPTSTRRCTGIKQYVTITTGKEPVFTNCTENTNCKKKGGSVDCY